MPGPPTNTYGTPCPNMAWPAYQHIQSSLHKHVSCLACLPTHTAGHGLACLPTHTNAQLCGLFTNCDILYKCPSGYLQTLPGLPRIQMHSPCFQTAALPQMSFACSSPHKSPSGCPQSWPGLPRIQMHSPWLQTVALLTNVHQAVLNRGLARRSFKCTAPASKL